MRVTMRKWRDNYGCPALYDVLVDGRTIGGGDTSEGRVLKMGTRYLPVLDGYDFLPGGFERRKDAAEYVAECAQAQGRV